MGKITFTKLNGAGNDFVLIDKKFNPDLELTPKIIKYLTTRRTGIGADGVLLFSKSDSSDFDVSYFNADGTTGALCANGARCAIRYAHHTKWIFAKDTLFNVNGIEYAGEIVDNINVKFFLKEPKILKQNFVLKALNRTFNATYINTGAPHVIIKINELLRHPKLPDEYFSNIKEIPVREWGKEIREHPDFAPDGTNVNFVHTIGNLVYIRSYERGVEDETLACGTGSVAAAISYFLDKKVQPPVQVIPRSREELVINFKFFNEKFTNLSITGPAKITFNGEFSI